MKTELADGESTLHEGPANHWKKGEAVGGELTLTTDRLIFESHRFNIQRHAESYLIRNIVDLEVGKNLFIIKNGLEVTFQDGAREKFVVDNRSDWIKEIKGAIGEA